MKAYPFAFHQHYLDSPCHGPEIVKNPVNALRTTVVIKVPEQVCVHVSIHGVNTNFLINEQCGMGICCRY